MDDASVEEQEKCYSTINKAVNKPGILRIVKPFAAHLVPKMTLPEYPKPLPELYTPSALLLNYPQLLKECETVYMSYKVLLLLLIIVLICIHLIWSYILTGH